MQKSTLADAFFVGTLMVKISGTTGALWFCMLEPLHKRILLKSLHYIL